MGQHILKHHNAGSVATTGASSSEDIIHDDPLTSRYSLGATLTVIKEREQGLVFGGYADVVWHCHNGFISSLGGAFLFALRCRAGLGPTALHGWDGYPEDLLAGAQRFLAGNVGVYRVY